MNKPPLAMPQRVLLDVQGRPIPRSVAQPEPERVTAVRFIRQLAENAGGIRSATGQALHRVVGQMVRLQEELARVSRLHDLRGDHTDDMVDAAAAGIYGVAQEQMERATGKRPDDWHVVRDTPEGDMYRVMAIAALGGPVFPPLASNEDMQDVEE